MSVLLVDDDLAERARLRAQLRDQGIDVTVAGTIVDAQAALAVGTYGVMIVARTLPDGSGLEILDQLRTAGSATHIIVVSGSAADADRAIALERGADDYVVKPVYLRELTERVMAAERRSGDPIADARLQIGHLTIDLHSRVVTASGMRVELTAKEFDLLAYLAVRPGHVFDREQLLHSVWRSASDWQSDATVTEHIRRLRKKVEVDPAEPQILVTVHGVGYRLDLPSAEADESGEVESVVGESAPVRREPGEIIYIDGLIVACDQSAADLAGAASPDDVVGKRLMDFVAPTSLAAAQIRFIETAAGHPRRSELMDLRRGEVGELTAAVESIPAVWHGRPARRLRLTAVPDARARLRRLVTGVLGDLSDAVIITDLRAHIRSWNSAAERLYGWPEAEVRGRHLLDVMRWDGDDAQIREMWEHLERIGRWHGESTQLARDGSLVEILSSSTLVRDTAGDPLGIVFVNRGAVIARHASSLEQDATLVARMRQGLSENEFQVHYQPVVYLPDRRLIALEALVRWKHPERGLLAPDEFLSTAERSGLIVELGELVLDEACRQAAEWRRSGAEIYLSVNVSTKQLIDPGMVERFSRIIRDSGLEPENLWLEVTETAVVEELEKVSEVLHQLADHGIGVSIDDFGTGWASLTYLRSFPVHALKIDRTFVAKAGQTANDAAIVRSVLALGAELDLVVVAEGIETQDQLEELTKIGCLFGQGYLFGRPVPAGEVLIETADRISTASFRFHSADRTTPVDTFSAGVESTTTSTPMHGAVAVEDLAPLPWHQQRQVAAMARLDRPAMNAGGVGVGVGVESDLVANFLRGLLRIRSAPAAAELLHNTIRGLGGFPVPVVEAGEHALPIDVSLGEGEPALVDVERFTVARMQLERLLPRLVEDARQAVNLLRQTERLVEETGRDDLTGLANRRILDRVLPRATTGTVVMIDLDHFKDVNDEHGHAAGDDVLVAFGKVLTDQVRARDISCRLGGEEFALVLSDSDVNGALDLVGRIRTTWAAAAPLDVTFSAGVAAVDADGGTSALIAADRALYVAKASGRDRTELAHPRVDGPAAS